MLKQFKAESKRLLDLMINSIYTNREIFLREVISNASDAMDKLHFISLTDAKASRDFGVKLETDKSARILRVIDNGIGMSAQELENNLGTIARSGTLDFKKENEKDAAELIGQFGVGFYSCFMVADEVTVTSLKYGETEAHQWKSKGADGYSLKAVPAPESCGTCVELKIKEDDDFKYSDYLDMNTLSRLVKKYSDYIRYPITGEIEKYEPKKEGSGYDKVLTATTLNSMTPIWKRQKGKVKQEEYEEFYRDTFHDYEKPVKTIAMKVEGNIDYSALLFIPSKAPYDFYTKDFKPGLRLYSAGVLIMENCEKLLPDYLAFMRGVVDSSDLSLNISREMLQHDRQLNVIAASLEKKIMAELAKMRDKDRETYEKFFATFGLTVKYGAYNGFGAKIDDLKDYFLFFSTDGDKYVTLKEYVASMKEGQTDIYYASGSDIKKIGALPQVTALKKKGSGVLLLADNVDEFIIKIMMSYDGKKFVSALGGGLASSGSEEEKETSGPIIEAMKAALQGKVKEVKLSDMLGDFASGLSAAGELSIEMAKVLSAMPGAEKIKPDFVLEINPSHALFQKAAGLHSSDKAKFDRLTQLLYEEAQLALGNPPESPAELVGLINEFID